VLWLLGICDQFPVFLLTGIYEEFPNVKTKISECFFCNSPAFVCQLGVLLLFALLMMSIKDAFYKKYHVQNFIISRKVSSKEHMI
jgi:hypothetical protein